MLADRGADMLVRNKWECTAVHFAALAGQLEVCQWLHARGVPLEEPNTQGHNALHKAAYGGHAHLCRWLVDGPPRIDPALADVRGQTVADLARKAGFSALAVELSGGVA
jgi:ankyrin repeat protein